MTRESKLPRDPEVDRSNLPGDMVTYSLLFFCLSFCPPSLPAFFCPSLPSRLLFFSSTGPTYTQPLLHTSRGLNAVPPSAGVLPYIFLAAFEVLHNGVYSAAPSPAFNVIVTSASSSDQHRRGRSSANSISSTPRTPQRHPFTPHRERHPHPFNCSYPP